MYSIGDQPWKIPGREMRVPGLMKARNRCPPVVFIVEKNSAAWIYQGSNVPPLK